MIRRYPTTIYQKILSEKQSLSKEITTIQNKLSKLPAGKLLCAKNGSQTKWYVSDGHHQTYISKKNRAYAEQLAARKYLMTLEKNLKQELKAIDFYLRHHAAKTDNIDQLFAENSGYAELLSPYFKPLSQKLQDWMNSPYAHNENHPEHLIHKTTSGIFVRSKSEAMIAMALHMNRIPFRYECALQLGESTVFPDFTIRHPHTGQLYYWEHFGMMDNFQYRQKVLSKLDLYVSHHIFPDEQLIITYEAKEAPLSPDVIENKIQFHFL